MQDTDHSEFQELLPDFTSGALGGVEWLMVRTHLAECAHCRAELRRPELPNRAGPKLVTAGGRPPQTRGTAPTWTVVLGAALVAGLVIFGLGYAMTS